MERNKNSHKQMNLNLQETSDTVLTVKQGKEDIITVLTVKQGKEDIITLCKLRWKSYKCIIDWKASWIGLRAAQFLKFTKIYSQ